MIPKELETHLASLSSLSEALDNNVASKLIDISVSGIKGFFNTMLGSYNSVIPKAQAMEMMGVKSDMTMRNYEQRGLEVFDKDSRPHDGSNRKKFYRKIDILLWKKEK